MNAVSKLYVEPIPDGLYILAVSGGIDSVVLLDSLAQQTINNTKLQFIVAHIDHGVRSDSAADARFVAALAAKYALPFELETLQLGSGVSEDTARVARYKFLDKLLKLHNADAIITAHHASDIVETIILNIMRGTGWRGLCSLRSENTRLRPLLSVTKDQIVAEAAKLRLEWCEDATNQTDDYLRNRIRHDIIPRCRAADASFFQRMLTRYDQQLQLRAHIEDTAAQLYSAIMAHDSSMSQALFMQLGDIEQGEMLRLYYESQGIRQTRPQLQRAATFARTAVNGKRFSLNSRSFLELRSGNLVIKTKN